MKTLRKMQKKLVTIKNNHGHNDEDDDDGDHQVSPAIWHALAQFQKVLTHLKER